MKTVLIYVLSSANDHYPQLLRASLDTWSKPEVAGVQSYFYSDPTPTKHKNVLSFPVGRGIREEMKQDYLAFRWALNNLKWDYMARPNASCYVRKTKLLEYVQGLPDRNLFRGILAPKSDGTSYLWGGLQFIFSRDVVQSMVDRWDFRSQLEIEDIGLSLLASRIGIPLDGNGRSIVIARDNSKWKAIFYDEGSQGAFLFDNFSELSDKASRHHFFRLRQFPENPAMTENVMHEMFKNNLC